MGIGMHLHIEPDAHHSAEFYELVKKETREA